MTPLTEYLIQRGVPKQDELLAKITFEGRTGATMKCIVSGRKAEFPLSVTVETSSALGSVCVFPLSPVTVREWTDSLWVGSDKKGEDVRKKIEALEEQLARAELAVASARQQEKVRLAWRKGAISRQERAETAASAARARTQRAFEEDAKWRKANENALVVARRELADPVALERTLQRRFTRDQADVIRLYAAVPEAAKDEALSQTVLTVLAARHFSSVQQQRYVQARVLEIKNGGLVGRDGAKLCGTCGAPARLRYGRRGAFWGCTKYPTCRWLADARSDVEKAKIEAAVEETKAKREGRSS